MSLKLVYVVLPAYGGWKVGVYMRGGIVDLQMPNADCGRVWRYKKNAQKRALELERDNRPIPLTISNLCCVSCKHAQLFVEQNGVYVCICCDGVLDLVRVENEADALKSLALEDRAPANSEMSPLWILP